MKRRSLGVAALLAAFVPAVVQENLLDEGSFEAATNDSDISNSNWSMVANAPGGGPSARFSTSVWAASDGETGVWFRSFQGSSAEPANATLSQSVIAPRGGSYTLLFDSARETHVTGDSWLASLTASSGPSDSFELLTATYNDDGNMNSDPTRFSLTVNGVNAGDTLTVSVDMVNGVDAGSNPQSLMVDHFRLIPEPVSVALVGVGLAGLLGVRRRR